MAVGGFWRCKQVDLGSSEPSPNQLNRLGMESPLAWKCCSEQLVGCPIEHSWDVDGTKGPQMLLTPEEEVAGELLHATGAQTALPVDIRNGRSVVRTDQNVLALKAPSETAQGKAYC